MLNHNYTGCRQRNCQQCAGFLDGAEAGQLALARTLRHVRDYGRFPEDVNARKSCADPCEHDFCAILDTIAWCYQAMEQKANADNAKSWELANPVWRGAFGRS